MKESNESNNNEVKVETNKENDMRLEQISREEKRKKLRKNVIESCIIIIICVAIYSIIQTFFIQLVRTDQLSMYPTIGQDEIWLVDKWSWITEHNLKRGDIILFQEPSVLFYDDSTYNEENIIAKYDNMFSNSMSKRVIALPGEHIYIKDEKVYVNGIKLEEPYLHDPSTNLEESVRKCYFLDITVPDDCVFVMGDNRRSSDDSRNYGCIPFDKIQGFMEKKLYPVEEKYSKAEIAELVKKNLNVDNYKIEEITIPLVYVQTAGKCEIINSGYKNLRITYNISNGTEDYIYTEQNIEKEISNTKVYNTNSKNVRETQKAGFSMSIETIEKQYSTYLRCVFEDAYTYRYIGEEEIDGEKCIVCDFIEDEDITLGNDTYRYWIREKDGIILKIKEDEVIKFYKVELNQVTDDDFKYRTDTSNYSKIVRKYN